MKLIVGLGNPGQKYEGTRHNVGFMVVDKLADRFDIDFKKEAKFDASVAEKDHDGEKILLVKPQTFMNLSGKSVSELKLFYKIDPKDIWVVTDEYDLPVGTLRTRSNFKTSGHKGVSSVIEHLSTNEFNLVRIGIYSPSKLDIGSLVLAKFEDREIKILDQVIEKTVDLILEFLKNGFKSHTIDLSE